jgi:DNA-binding CsgD family transcriptional regulator
MHKALTPREKQIVELVGRTFTNKQIANQFYITEKTVIRHMENIFHKLDVSNRYEVAAYARRLHVQTDTTYVLVNAQRGKIKNDFRTRPYLLDMFRI